MSQIHQRAIIILPDSPAEVESVYVLKEEDGNYRINSIPYFAYNLSLNDIVECLPDEDGDGLFVEKIIKKSGNKTFRVLFKCKDHINHSDAIRFVEFLTQNNLIYDVFPPMLLSINLPVSFSEEVFVARLDDLTKTNSDIVWEAGDPNLDSETCP